MAKSRASMSSNRSRPALTEEAREKQLIAKAMNQVERQLDDGTASSQVLTYFLKLASEKHQAELEKLQRENELLKAKAEALESQKRVEELYSDALDAMKRYSGQVGPNDR